MIFEPQPRPRRRRARRAVMSLFAVFVAAILLLLGDRVASAIAANDMAEALTANGFPVKPSVTIEGFPFLTQLAARQLRRVDISAGSVPAGPVTITRISATLRGLRFGSSFGGATADRASATLFVSFSALAAAGGLGGGAGITITPAGPGRLTISAADAGASGESEQATVRQTGPRQVSVRVLGGGAARAPLSSFGDFSFTLPRGMPAALRITGMTLGDRGLTLSAAGTGAALGG